MRISPYFYAHIKANDALSHGRIMQTGVFKKDTNYSRTPHVILPCGKENFTIHQGHQNEAKLSITTQGKQDRRWEDHTRLEEDKGCLRGRRGWYLLGLTWDG